MGNTLGTCATWPFVGAITQAFGWDWGFYVISIQMGVFLIIFWLVTADSPADHRWISEEEKNYIMESQGGTVTKKKVSMAAVYEIILMIGLFEAHLIGRAGVPSRSSYWTIEEVIKSEIIHFFVFKLI